MPGGLRTTGMKLVFLVHPVNQNMKGIKIASMQLQKALCMNHYGERNKT
jgi:hypothetical protein